MSQIPLALYVHIPWCERKCPYCDFNSHVSDSIPEAEYSAALINELEHYRDQLAGRQLVSVFFGGGTPSLFSAQSIGAILNAAERYIGFSDSVEITLEANPGSAERGKFSDYHGAGVNRLSIGVQSFNDRHLQRLGRIHSANDALHAVQAARDAGFSEINIDLMYGLGEQTLHEALTDLDTAIGLTTSHLSWYQLTIEQNTAYFKLAPALPKDIIVEAIETQGRKTLTNAGYTQYEVSAYAKPGSECVHNSNYWQFGDYLGIGAGAHSKLTNATGGVRRIANTRLPKHYLAHSASNTQAREQPVAQHELAAEFMMNALRLREGVTTGLFSERTNLSDDVLSSPLAAMLKIGAMEDPKSCGHYRCTASGYQLLNSVVEQFL